MFVGVVCYFIRFVVKRQARDLQHIQVLHDRKYRLFMLFMIGVRCIDDMDQKVYILLSSKVDLKLDNSVGRSWIKSQPYRSAFCRLPVRWMLLVVASKVAKSSSAFVLALTGQLIHNGRLSCIGSRSNQSKTGDFKRFSRRVSVLSTA